MATKKKSTKPTTTLRRRAAGKSPAPAPKTATAAPKRARTTPEQQAKLAALPRGKRAKSADAEPVRVPGAVERKGRLLADGTRTPVRDLRRVTLYLPVPMVARIEESALRTRSTLSLLVESELREEYGT